MQHKTFRDLSAHQKTMDDKVRPIIQDMSKLTLEEITYVQYRLNHMIWLSMQQVEEKDQVNQNSNDNE